MTHFVPPFVTIIHSKKFTQKLTFELNNPKKKQHNSIREISTFLRFGVISTKNYRVSAPETCGAKLNAEKKRLIFELINNSLN